ncbi:MAG: calcium/proton exchanger [Bacteroidales bacterium]
MAEKHTRTMTRSLLRSRLNVLLVFAPISWFLAVFAPASPWLFAGAAASILPLAGLIREATDGLAARSGPTLGGFLNATFGNAAELIIGVVALRAGHIELVKASLSGSIIGNLLVVLGVSMLVGGLRHGTQHFNRRTASNATIMLFLAVVALVMPALFNLATAGGAGAPSAALVQLSVWTSVLLIAAYVGGLIYTFTAKHDPLAAQEPAPSGGLTVRGAVGLLVVASALTTVQADLLTDGLEPVLDHLGITEFFAGVVVVALVGSVGEYYAAVAAAARNQMSLATHIAIASSAQIAMLIAPALMIVSLLFGQPMTLLFHPLEIAGIGLAVVAVGIVSLDGESNWLEGLQLVAVYLVLAGAFYLLPR